LLALIDKLFLVFQCNPMLLQTAEVVDIVRRLRCSLASFNHRLKGLLAISVGEELEEARIVEHAARPYLKKIYQYTQTAITAAGVEVTDELEKAAIWPLVVKFELDKDVENIKRLAHDLELLLVERGDKREYRKVAGSAGRVRVSVTRQLRNVLYTILPALYDLTEQQGVKTAIDDAAFHINSTLDSFRHLILNMHHGDHGDDNLDGSGGDGGSGAGDGDFDEQRTPLLYI
jgi:hypothetical protein